MKNLAVHRTQKGYLCTVSEMTQEGRASPYSTLPGNMRNSRLFCHFYMPDKSTASIDFLQINCS